MDASSLLGLSVMVLLICSGGAARMLRQTDSSQLVLTMEGLFIVAGASYTWQGVNNLAEQNGLPDFKYVGKTTLPSISFGQAHLLTFNIASSSSQLSAIFTAASITAAIVDAQPLNVKSSVVRSLVISSNGVVYPTPSVDPVVSPSPSPPPPPPPPKGNSETRASPSPPPPPPPPPFVVPTPEVPVIVAVPDSSPPPPPPPPVVDNGGRYTVTLAVTLAGQPKTVTNIYIMLAIMNVLNSSGTPGNAVFVGKTTLPSVTYGNAYIASYSLANVSGSTARTIVALITASAINNSLGAVMPATIVPPVANSVAGSF